MTNPTRLDAVAGAAARDEAVDRVEVHADEAWKAVARQWVSYIANTRPTFTTDDVWAAGLEKPSEPRAMGAIIREFTRQNFLEFVGYQKTAQVSRHRAPIAVWRKR